MSMSYFWSREIPENVDHFPITVYLVQNTSINKKFQSPHYIRRNRAICGVAKVLKKHHINMENGKNIYE